MRIYYDEEGDFLEISIGKPMNCYASEIEQGVFVRKDEKSDKIKSVGILGFKKRTKSIKDMGLNLPFDIQFSEK